MVQYFQLDLHYICILVTTLSFGYCSSLFFARMINVCYNVVLYIAKGYLA